MKNIKFQIVKYFFILVPTMIVHFGAWMNHWNLYERSLENCFIWVTLFLFTLFIIPWINMFIEDHKRSEHLKKLMNESINEK